MIEHTPLSQEWFRIDRPEPGVFTIEEPLHAERVKSYVIVGERRAVLLDAGMGIGDIKRVVEELTDRPLTVVISHAHWDHIGGCHAFAGQAEILAHPTQAAALAAGIPHPRMHRYITQGLDGQLPAAFDLAQATIPGVAATSTLVGGEILDLGDRMLEVLAVPGHAPGLLALLDRERGALFSTDAAYAGALYAQFDDSDLAAYQTTLVTLAILAPALRAVYPAHGDSPMSPALLPAMRDAIDQVIAGRAPDTVEHGVAHHWFTGFALFVAARP